MYMHAKRVAVEETGGVTGGPALSTGVIPAPAPPAAPPLQTAQ
jgi:hypothetical protein